ncbi:MAG: prephenate dehydratase [Planctomycetota bacterium]|nr:prephenate dehydratase [Planctomycetota bacterium]
MPRPNRAPAPASSSPRGRGRRPDPTRATSTPRAAADALAPLRASIDDLDRRLVALLNERSRLVVEVGKVKRTSGIPVYAPHREAQVLSKVLALNAGPLPPRTIEAIYRELMSGSFVLEQPMRIGYLGPAGSFSHLVAVRHFGSSVDFEDLRAVRGVFEEVVRGHVDHGLVPIENSIHGGITETLDCFTQFAGDVRVYAEAQLAVHHTLLANCKPSSIRKIYSRPEVFAQCRAWLATQYPQAELVPVSSSSKGVQMVAEESGQDETREGPGVAAIGSTLAGELYGVNVLFRRIEDNPGNITRFYVISRQCALRTGDDKTSVMFSTMNKPGALVSVLSAFQKAGVNLTHIDKRPGGRRNWQYTFFVDAEGHETDPRVAKALVNARKHCRDLTVLGSYPRSTRVL